LVRIWSVDYASFREQGIFSVAFVQLIMPVLENKVFFQWAFGRLIMPVLENKVFFSGHLVG
jgi:hypothetical protein